MSHEIEVKIAIGDANETAAAVEAVGGRSSRPRVFEDNRLFDLPGDVLARAGKLLRVRSVGGRGVVTVKAPAGEEMAGYKVKRELETAVEDPDAFASLLVEAGFVPRWRYQKYRRSYDLEGTKVEIDETPIGSWLEIEGPPKRIDRVAGLLGWGRESYQTLSYRDLHERYCEEAGVPVGDLVFGDGA